MNRFKPVAGLALALVPAKLVKNEQAKYAKFLDTNDPKLNLKIYIGHKSATLDKKIGTFEGKKMMTLKGTQPTTKASRYFIITSPTSYKNNILYYLSTHETSFIIVPVKKR